MPIKAFSEYKRAKEAVRTMYENDRSGDQSFFKEQERLFKPITSVQKGTTKRL